MLFIVVDIAKGNKIVNDIAAFILVMTNMVQLKHFSGIITT